VGFVLIDLFVCNKNINITLKNHRQCLIQTRLGFGVQLNLIDSVKIKDPFAS
jgi:hypothetical protein